MGTRSTIAEPNGDGFKGRYCHWDGYPTSVGRKLFAIVNRDGVDAARQTLLHANTYWSSIDPDQLAEVEPTAWFDGEPLPNYTQEDDRFSNVVGYGIAGTGQGVEQDEWIEKIGDWGTEWTYVIGDSSLFIFNEEGVKGHEVPWHANLQEAFWVSLEDEMMAA